MFHKPTVMILGAGASAPYRLPFGDQFRNELCNLTGATDFLRDLDDKGIGNVAEFLERFRWSGAPSPDRFLEEDQHRVYVPAGKYCIARVLIGHENEQFLSPPHAPPESWYELLGHELRIREDAYFDNQLTIVTFNYDRSLEHYLWKRINAVFMGNEAEIGRRWRNRPRVIHVHGELGAYDPTTNTGRAYAADLSLDMVELAADGIQILHEVDPSSPELEQAAEALTNAKRILFFGFGFDHRNVRRLRVFSGPLPDDVIVGGTQYLRRRWEQTANEVFLGYIRPNAFGDRVPIHEYLLRLSEISAGTNSGE